MILGNYLLTILLGFIVLFNFEDCGNRKLANGKTDLKVEKTMIVGNFSSQLPKTPGFIKLENEFFARQSREISIGKLFF